MYSTMYSKRGESPINTGEPSCRKSPKYTVEAAFHRAHNPKVDGHSADDSLPVRATAARGGPDLIRSGGVGQGYSRVSLNITKPIQIGNVDIAIPARRNAGAFGKVNISKGAIDRETAPRAAHDEWA